jgi:hypothetical protein
MEALEAFPKKADKLRTEAGTGQLIKTDIFRGLMYYTYRENRGMLYPIPVEKVHEILALNREGKKPADLQTFQEVVETAADVFEYEDVTGAVELPAEKRRKKRKSNSRRRQASPAAGEKTDTPKPKNKRSGRRKNRRRGGGKKPDGNS